MKLDPKALEAAQAVVAGNDDGFCHPTSAWAKRVASETVTAYLSNLQPSKEVRELVEELRHLVSLNDPSRGGPYAGHAADRCMKAMTRAADLLSRIDGEGWRPKVKALDWTEQAIPPAGECLAYSPVGLYCIPLGGRAFCVRFRDKGEGDGPYPTLDAAKAAAQADYERRILSALEPSPSIEDPTQGSPAGGML